MPKANEEQCKDIQHFPQVISMMAALLSLEILLSTCDFYFIFVSVFCEWIQSITEHI